MPDSPLPGDDPVVSILVNTRPVRPRVSLVVRNEYIEPALVTDLLEIQPDKAYRKGEVIAPSQIPKSRGIWLFSSEALSEESDLQSHLEWLLRKLENKNQLLSELVAQGYSVEIVCRFGIAHWNTNFRLSPSLLALLAHLGVPCVFDVYDETE